MRRVSLGNKLSSRLSSHGKKSRGLDRAARAVVLGLLVAPCPVRARAAEVPKVSAEMGPCTADFTVADSSNKPLYDAKIHLTIAYGFLSKRRQELEVGTNSDGKARFEGLPDRLKKKPLEFQVRFGAQTKSTEQDPEVNCHASFDVTLTKS